MKPKDRKRIIINSPERLKLAQKLVSELDLSEVWVVEIKAFKRNRSIEQNNCWHGWCSVVADEVGVETIDFKEEGKQRWLVPMMERDDKDFAEQLSEYRKLYQAGQTELAQRLADLLRKKVSTTWLNVTQFKELLDSLEKFASELGIVLPKREQYEERY